MSAKLIAALILSVVTPLLDAADKYVCNAPRTKPGGSSCDYTSTQIQGAVDAALDGDTLHLQEALTYADVVLRRRHAVPVTITSMLSDWLPCVKCRITPSYDGLLPVLSPSQTSINLPALQGQLDGVGQAPSGWNLIGIEIRTGAGRGRDNGGQYNGSAVHTGGQVADAIAFGGGGPSATTTGTSATIKLTGYVVTNYDIGRTLRIGGNGGPAGTNFTRGDYLILSVDPVARTWTLDRNCSTGAGSGLSGYAGWFISNDHDQPNNWTFDRILFRDDYDDQTNQQNWLRLNGYNLTLLNSFMWPLFGSGHESHGVSIATSSGLAPITLTNNFISAAGIPVFSGGVDSDYLDGSKAWTNVSYNYMFKPYKWWPPGLDSSTGGVCISPGTGTCVSSGNPFPQYYVANGSKLTCTKNLGEWKSSIQGLMQFNVHENSWSANFCEGQYFGFTNSVRQLTDNASGSNSNLQITIGSNTFQISGSRLTSMPFDRLLAAIDTGICAYGNPSGVHDCRRIVSYDPATGTGTVNNPWTFSQTSDRWFWTRERYYVQNLTMRNSVWRNVNTGVSTLFRDRFTATPASEGGGNWGRVKGWIFENSLFYNTLRGIDEDYAIKFVTQEAVHTVDPTVGGSDVNISHITFQSLDSYRKGFGLISNLNDYTNVAKLNNFRVRSVLFPQLTDQGGYFNSFGSALNGGFGNHFCDLEFATTGNVQWLNNYLMSSTSGTGCSNAKVSGNITAPQLPRYLLNTHKLVPGNILTKAGHDGSDIGVNPDSLPLISNLSVSVSANAALVEFDLTGPIADAGGSQPCVLEVSANNNLESYLGGYSVIPDLNPLFFRQPDFSGRTNPALLSVAVNSGHVAWPVGQPATVTGDDGSLHNLALSPDTQYYGRLQCYGDTNAFRFRTSETASGASVQRMQFAPPSDTASVRVDYGSTSALSSTVQTTVDAQGRASVMIPATGGHHLYSRVLYKDQSGADIYRGPLQIVLP